MFEVRLDPDDGTRPAVLGFDEYKGLFGALSTVDPALLQPLKRFRGRHARFDIPPPSVPAAIQEIEALRKAAGSPSPFLEALAHLARLAQDRNVGLAGRSP